MKNITVLLLIAALILLNQCKTSDKSGPTPDTSSNREKGGSLSRFAVHNGYLYTVDSEYLTAYKLDKEGKPDDQSKKSKVGMEIETIFPFKDKLFIGSATQLYIYSLDDPANPKQEGAASSQAVTYRCDPIVAKDDVAYATLRTGSNGCRGWRENSVLAVYDVKDVTKPTEKATIPIDEPYGLGYSDTVLYVCLRGGLTLFDISEPLNPKAIKTIKDGWFKDVIVYDSLLICWTADDGLKLYNISNPSNPTLLETIF